jgi:pyruvate/2-oxoglutarate dehydrogenase complex dihydrolipoamide dehydrogenase (E3) component
MPQPERFEGLVLGSGTGGKLIAWHLAQSGHRTAVVERRWIGGACPNIACMPSKNEIANAKVAHLVRHGAEHGVVAGSITVDMATVRRRKREMVERQIAAHLQKYKASGAELIMGSGRFLAPKTLEVILNDGGTCVLTGDKVFLDVGTHAAIFIELDDANDVVWQHFPSGRSRTATWPQVSRPASNSDVPTEKLIAAVAERRRHGQSA